MNSQENVTFSLLLRTFYAKAKDTGIPMEPKLNFVLKTFITKDEIKRKYEVLIGPVLNESDRWKIIGKLPDGADRKKGRAFFFPFIEIDQFEQVAISRRFSEFYKQIEFELDENDRPFIETFKRWKNTNSHRNQIKQVLEDLKSMQSEYTSLLDKFQKDMTRADELKENIEVERAVVTLFGRKCLNATDVKNLLKNAEEIFKHMKNIGQEELDLERQFGYMIEWQVKLNSERQKWADLLIGLRETLDSNRKLVPSKAKSRFWNKNKNK